MGCCDGVEPLKGHTAAIYSVGFSPEDQKVMSGGHDSTMRIWDARSGINILGPLVVSGALYSVVFSRDDKRMAAAGDFGIDIRDAKTGIPIRPLRDRKFPIRTLARKSLV